MNSPEVTFVCWLWEAAPGSARRFAAEHVNVLRNMLARHYHAPHKLVCITDNTKGLDSRVEAMRAPNTGLEHLLSPMRKSHAAHARAARKHRAWRHGPTRPLPSKQAPTTVVAAQHFPACYRRLWLFSEQAKALGEWLFLIDIDVVITGDITHLPNFDADFTGWCDPKKFGWDKVAGGAWLLRAGSNTAVWNDFDVATSPAIAKAAGCKGSDQGWLSYMLKPTSTWSRADGLYKINWLPYGKLPARAKLIFTAGDRPPWSDYAHIRWPWLAHHWR